MSCKISIIKLIAIAAVMLSGCTNDSDVLPEGEGGTMTFQLSTRAGNGIGEGQQVRLFVAERAQEHSGYPELSGNTNMEQFHPTVSDDDDPYEIYGQPEEDLHVVETIDLGGSSYQVTGLYGQWYKFAFVCTPTIGEELFGPEPEAEQEPNHNFGECYIDYEPVLEYQSNLNAAQDEDLAIYRKVIDRWADASSPLTEDVTLTRQTGELVLNMGIPEDQFDDDEGEVHHFKITLQTPTQMYVRDMARDSVLIAAVPSEHTFIWNVTSQSEEQEIHISLLPDVDPDFELLAEGDDEEETPAVTDERRLYYLAVEAFDAKGTTIPFKDIEGKTKDIAVIQDINNENGMIDRNILIRKNIRTTVLFNGMTTEQFEIRYAGFDNNAVVDVDDDAWDGEN